MASRNCEGAEKGDVQGSEAKSLSVSVLHYQEQTFVSGAPGTGPARAWSTVHPLRRNNFKMRLCQRGMICFKACLEQRPGAASAMLTK